MNKQHKAYYTLYSIKCVQNDREYIGVTQNAKRRFRAHRSSLRRGTHVNKELQSDYNLMGLEAFEFTKIRTLLPQQTALRLEKRLTRELVNTYNISEGGRGHRGRSITWNGVKYPSMVSASTTLEIREDTLRTWIKKGYTCDADVPANREGVSVVWNDVLYPSIGAAARACGITRASMKLRLSKGYTHDSDMQCGATKAIPTIWNNREYPSITAAAQALGITDKAMRYRLKKGYTCDADLKQQL